MRSPGRSTRVLAPLLVGLLLLMEGPGVGAQSRQEVDETRARRDEAATRVDRAEAERSALGGELLVAIDEYQRVTAEMTDLAFGVAALRQDLLDMEADVRRRRSTAGALVAEAYMGAVAGDFTVVADAPSVLDALIGREMLTRAAGRTIAEIDGYHTARAELRSRRTAFEAAQGRIGVLRETAGELTARLGGLVDGAQLELIDARGDAVEAEAEYEAAVDRLEAARHGLGAGVLAWEPLVAQYFPAALVWEALQVMHCESRGRPDAVNRSSGATGLFQFLDGTWLFASAGAGYPGAARQQPEANIAAAAWLVRHSEILQHPRGRWGHWACQPWGTVGPPP